MNSRIFSAVVVIGALILSTGALYAADIKPFTIDGVNYTKWLWGTSRRDGSLYNFTTIPGEGQGDNGQGTELELLVSARPSSKIEVSGRMKARFNQNFWTNFGGFGGGGAGDPGSGDCVSGDCGEFDSRSAQYVKFRGLTIILTPGYSWLDTATIGSSDFGMFDPWTIGKIRYIDRDNGAGIILQGGFADRKIGYDFVRISLPRLWAGPDYNTGDYNVQDAGYGFQLRINPATPLFDGALIWNWVNDIEVDQTDLDFDDGRDVTTRSDNTVWGARFGIHPSQMFDIRGAFYSSDSSVDCDLASCSFGLSGFSPILGGDNSDTAWYADVDINDPFKVGVNFNLQFFDIGADYVSTLAARRESDVLITEGRDSVWALPGPDNSAFGVFGGNPTQIGIGGWQGTAQQVATINVDNEFTDFDEPMAETAIGWKGFTLLVPWTIGDLDLHGEYTYIDYNTNWQAWGSPDRSITDSKYPNFASDAGVAGDFRTAYAPFQDKETDLLVLKGNYYFDVGNGLEIFGKLKWINETDKRMTDERFLPFVPGDCPGGGVECGNVVREGNASTDGWYFNPPVITNEVGQTGYQWKPFDDVSDDDKDLDYFHWILGASYQLSSELWGSLSWESYDITLLDGNTAFQAYQLHLMSSGDLQKDKIILILKYNIGGAEIGFNYEYNTLDFKPNFGGGFVPTLATEETAATFGIPVGSPGFSGRFGGWNPLIERNFEQQRLKAFLKLRF